MRIKILIALCIFSFNAFGDECKLTAVLESGEEIITSIGTTNADQCEEIAKSSGENNFFNLTDDNNAISDVSLTFEELEN